MEKEKFELEEILEIYGEEKCIYVSTEIINDWTRERYKYDLERNIATVDSKHNTFSYEKWGAIDRNFLRKVKEIKKIPNMKDYILCIRIIMNGKIYEFKRNNKDNSFKKIKLSKN